MVPTFVIVDDHEEIRRVFKWYAENYGFKVVGEAADGRDALALMRKLKPRIATIDLILPGMSGIDLIACIHREQPRMKLVALTGRTDGEAMGRAIAAGACAHLVKPVNPEEFGPIMDKILRGEHALSASAVEVLWKTHSDKVPYDLEVRLTPRQSEVVVLVVSGLSNKETASRLSISVRTVEKYRAEAMERLGVRSTAELVRFAIGAGAKAVTRGGGVVFTTP